MGKDRKKSSKKAKKSSDKKNKKDKKRRDVPAVQLSADDYFLRSEEFRFYLSSKKVSFESLSSEKAREQFSKFVKRWNRGKLEKTIYDLPASAREAIKSQHKWGMRLSDVERDALSDTAHRVQDLSRSTDPGLLPTPLANAADAVTGGQRAQVAPRPPE